MFPDEESHNVNADSRDGESINNATNETRHSQINAMDVSRHVDNIRKKEAHVIARTWRDLIPVIKLDICTVSKSNAFFIVFIRTSLCCLYCLLIVLPIYIASRGG